MAATQVYIEQLYKQKHGWPLWDPDSCEVYVGDVGFFERDSGSFCRLFNVLVEEGDPLNNRGVPADFEPLRLNPLDVRHTPQAWTPGQCLKSQTVTASQVEFSPLTSDVVPVNAGITFDCSKNVGALLLLRNHSSRIDLRSSQRIRDYIRQHLDSWYIFGRDQGFGEADAPENSIVLVRGCDKSDSWALAAFAERCQSASIFFNGGIYEGTAGIELRGSWRRHTISSAEHRDGVVTGPNNSRRRVDLTESTIWNALGVKPLSTCIDCLFVRVFRCRRRWGPIMIPLQIKAQAGPHQLPPGSPEDRLVPTSIFDRTLSNKGRGVDIELDLDVDLSKHPLDHLLEYMLEIHPGAHLAIASDDDLCTLLTPNEQAMPDNTHDVLRVLQPRIRLDSHMTALVDPLNIFMAPTIDGQQHEYSPSFQPLNKQSVSSQISAYGCHYCQNSVAVPVIVSSQSGYQILSSQSGYQSCPHCFAYFGSDPSYSGSYSTQPMGSPPPNLSIPSATTHYYDLPMRPIRYVGSDRIRQAAVSRRSQEPTTLICGLCQAAFTRKHNYDNHMLSHNDIRPHACRQPGCSSAFTRRWDRKRHEEACHPGVQFSD